MIRKFWGDQRGEQRKIHWKNWETLCKPKKGGSLDFKELNKFNDTMLTKQVWRIIHDMDSLFYRLFKSKYFPTSNIFDAKQSLGSYARKSILKARWVIVLGAKWRVGDGRSIQVFKDSWLPGNSGGKSHLPPLILASGGAMLCSGCSYDHLDLKKKKIGTPSN